MGRRESFDPDRSYVANRTFMCGGHTVPAGAPFPGKLAVDGRRFRQLYDGRYLRMLPVQETREPDGQPSFAKMGLAELRNWMLAHGVVPHEKTPLTRLVNKAKLLFGEIQRGIKRPPVTAGGVNGVVVGAVHQKRDRERIQGAAAQGNPTPRNGRHRQRIRGPRPKHH